MKKFLDKRYILIITFFFLSSAIILALTSVKAQEADDEKDDAIQNSTSSSAKNGTVSIEEETETIIFKDSDGDGLLDKDDPHPDIPEIYIVKDDNRNGIVDEFEK